ncbi:MAG: hypothetical protein PWQ60_1466 [Thermoanaerobacteraceae bacterium]|nr:hypothetical protein [Thermoanaerobacteraceae bacterium]
MFHFIRSASSGNFQRIYLLQITHSAGFDRAFGEGVECVADIYDALHVSFAVVPAFAGLEVVFGGKVGDPALQFEALLKVYIVYVRPLEGKLI